MSKLILKHILAVTLFFTVLLNNPAIAQVFTLRSFDGDEKSISLSLNENGTLTISCAKDTLYISNLTHVDTAYVLNKNFLRVDYGILAGSGLFVKRTLMLYVKNNSICQSLHITSLFREEFIDFRKHHATSNLVDVSSLYKAGLSLTKNDIQTYQLQVNIHGERNTKDHPNSNYNVNSQTNLNFDSTQNIFYSTHENVSQYFTIFDPKTQAENKQYIMGIFPVIQLGTYKYYYIKDEWYEKDEDASLSKYTYK